VRAARLILHVAQADLYAAGLPTEVHTSDARPLLGLSERRAEAIKQWRQNSGLIHLVERHHECIKTMVRMGWDYTPQARVRPMGCNAWMYCHLE
jgi:hypothetical protein